MKPVARRGGLVVRDLAGEVVVYDLERHEAHCLNETAARVYRLADGRRDVAGIARDLGGGESAGDESAVELALEQLAAARLLEPPLSSARPEGFSRREIMRKAAVGAAVALPLVTSVLAPTPAEAAATCVASCAGKPAFTPCNVCGGGVPPCPDMCDGAGSCSDGC